MKISRKWKNIFYNKTTFMVIPHSEKGIYSFHLSNIALFFIGLIFLLIVGVGFYFAFHLKTKTNDFEYYAQENSYYKSQIANIDKIIPNIRRSQNNLSLKIGKLFNILGIQEDNYAIESDLEEEITSQLDNIEYKMETIGSYVNSFRQLFNELPSIFPIVSRKYWFTSPFGIRVHPLSGKKEFHTGIDIAAFPGTPVQATANGSVSFSGWMGGYGLVVYINHMGGYSTRYAHLSRIAVPKGQYVRKGEIVGYVGSTGVSTGYHLHYEVRLNDDPINPISYIGLDRFWR